MQDVTNPVSFLFLLYLPRYTPTNCSERQWHHNWVCICLNNSAIMCTVPIAQWDISFRVLVSDTIYKELLKALKNGCGNSNYDRHALNNVHFYRVANHKLIISCVKKMVVGKHHWKFGYLKGKYRCMQFSDKYMIISNPLLQIKVWLWQIN